MSTVTATPVSPVATTSPVLVGTADATAVSTRIARRLLPLHVAVFASALVLWLPIEKLFLSGIGFTPALIGLMASVYAGVVPLLEVPSGLLADRWSRRGVLVLGALSMAGSSLLGGLSHGVGLYLLAAVLLGVTIALQSGTVDSMVYDVLVEESGSGHDFTRRIGTVRVLEGAALAVSALGGSALAAWTSPRTTYVATLLPMAVAVVAALRFREPRLHRGDDLAADEPTGLRAQLRLVVRVMADRSAVLPALVLGAAVGVALQLVYEFGPLWLVSFHAPTSFYGIHWALLTGMAAVGGRVAALVDWARPSVAPVAGVLMAAGAAATAISHVLAVVVAGQLLVALTLVVMGIRASQLMHDAIPSQVRSSVASGASTLTWLAFVPVGLGTGLLADAAGIAVTGWLLAAIALVASWLLHHGARRTVAS